MKALLFLLFLVKCVPDLHAVEKIQEFFIAAVETSWDYLNTDGVDPAANQRYSYTHTHTREHKHLKLHFIPVEFLIIVLIHFQGIRKIPL